MLRLFKFTVSWDASDPEELAYVQLHVIAKTTENALASLSKTLNLDSCRNLKIKVVGIYDITEGTVF